MIDHVVHDAELEVGQRADREGQALVDDAADERVVFQRAVAVVDAVDLEQVQRLPDVLRRAFFAGVGDAQQAALMGGGKDALELLRRMADLGAVEADARQLVEPGFGGLQGVERSVFREVAQEAEDQFRGDAEFSLGGLHGAEQTLDGDAERQAAVGVGLGVEEDLGVAPAIGGEASEIGHAEVVEVLLGQQHLGALVVDIQEVLQVGEGVGGPDLLDALERQLDAVALGQLEHQLGLEAALDVQMQLGLGQAPDEIGEIGAHGREPRAEAAARERSDWKLTLISPLPPS